MNSKQRILAAFRHEQTDRVPCSPLLGLEVVSRMTASEWDALLQQTDVTLNVGSLGDLAIFGGQYYLDQVRVNRAGNITATELETPLGLLHARTAVTAESGGGSTTIEHMGKNDEDIARLFSIPYEPPTFGVGRYHEWTARVGDEGLVAMGMCSAFRILLGFFGPGGLYLKMADDPDTMERIVATACERIELFIDACLDQGVEHFWMGGSEHCGPGVVNPRLFRRLITPYDRRIVARIHDRGGTVDHHIHGKLRAILDDIVQIGSDVVSPIETGLRGDVTLAEAKAAIGDRICLKGNLDDMAFLAIEPPETVRAAARDAIAQAASGGGYILSGTDAGIYSPEWVQSFLALAEVAREHPYV